MHKPIRQKFAMIGCYQAAKGDPTKTKKLYEELDKTGQVRRDSNVCPHSSNSYSHILFAQAVKLGWFEQRN